MKSLFVSLIVVLTFKGTAQNQSKSYTQFVNPFIGTAEHGHVFLGASVPNGAVQLGPSNIIQTWDKFHGWDWCSGYNYASKEILGFTHTHLSGTGIGDLNDILLLPATGNVLVKKGDYNNITSGYGSYFSHEKEVCQPGYYQVFLDRYRINAQLTATKRVALHQYDFSKIDSLNPHIIVDLSFGMGWDKSVKNNFTKINDSTFIGYRFSTGWATDQRVFFAIKTSKPIKKMELYDSTKLLENVNNAEGRQIKAALILEANNIQTEPFLVKVALSGVSETNALLNLNSEIPNWNFDAVKNNAETEWNKVLSRIDIDAADSVKQIFYTALYHSLMFPHVFNDANGDYRGADGKYYTDKFHQNYSVLSLWDTYRALHPLATIIQPEHVNDYVQTFLNIYQQQGKLPVWHLEGNETNTMIGYPAIPVIADAYLKGFKNYDTLLAYQAMKSFAMHQTDGINYVQKLQFIPCDSVIESVAKGLEYAISDGAISKMAEKFGNQKDAAYFKKRANLFQQYFDTRTNFMRGRVNKNTWRTPFNPVSAQHRINDYCEGNAWQYTWLVPQNVYGLINSFGSEQKFEKKLDSLFSISSSLDKNASPDISGIIGQYAHGNEPNHHIPYLYAYVGKPWKTAQIVRKVMDTFYTKQINGLCGNDDAGEMSAWYVFSALGFYPLNPYNGEYVFGSPLVDKATVYYQNKQFIITVKNNSKKNKYIQSVKINGQPYLKNYISHTQIINGGIVEIIMGVEPSLKGGVQKNNRPH